MDEARRKGEPKRRLEENREEYRVSNCFEKRGVKRMKGKENAEGGKEEIRKLMECGK